MSVSGAGTVTSSVGGISCPSSCTGNINSGSTVTFSATPSSGTVFKGWGGACQNSGTIETCILTINADTSISASFSAGVTVEELQARIEALEASLAGLEAMLAGVSRGVDPSTNQDTLFFDAMNVSVRSGAGATDATANGSGNLIIGYNENNSDTRTGSHNLVVGKHLSYSSYGGIVVGLDNATSGNYSSALGGGPGNLASGFLATVVGGEYNVASGRANAVFGGERNNAIGRYSSIVGGSVNTIHSGFATIAGGIFNSVAETAAAGVILGGAGNTVIGRLDTIAGGDNVVCDDGDYIQDESRLCGEGALSPVD